MPLSESLSELLSESLSEPLTKSLSESMSESCEVTRGSGSRLGTMAPRLCATAAQESERKE